MNKKENYSRLRILMIIIIINDIMIFFKQIFAKVRGCGNLKKRRKIGKLERVCRIDL